MQKIYLLIIVLLLSSCGNGFSNKAASTRAANDAYLTNATSARSVNTLAPSTSATLTASGSSVPSTTTIDSGLYSPLSVTLTCSDVSGSGCLATYYTIDGTTPSRASTVYSGPITIWSKTTLKYFSIDKAGNMESVNTRNFLIGSIKITNIKSVVTGWNHTLGIKKDGTLWAWGGNTFGQLGDATQTDQTKPIQIGTDTKWSVLSAGKQFTLGLKTDGTLWAWGLNDSGQLGLGDTANRNVPVQIGSETIWSKIIAGDSFALAIKNDGSLWSWGLNTKGQLGDGTGVNKNIPVQIGNGTDWIEIAAGYDHSVALKKDGTLWTWGGNYSGQLGQGTIGLANGSLVPLQVPGTNWSAIAAGGSNQAYANEQNIDATALENNWVGGFTIAMKSDGTLWAWGQNIFGQLGDGSNINMGWAGAGTYPLTGFVTFDRMLPFQIGTDTDWATISAGAGHTVALKKDGALWSWGLNVNGQLANGNPGMDNMLPLPVGIDTYLPFILPKKPWSLATAGGYQTLALRNDGTLWAWGWNGSGQLGDGTKYSSGGGSSPTKPTWRIPKYSYVISKKVFSYTIDYDPGSGSGQSIGSGQINSTGLAAVAAGTNPVAGAVDPSGQYMYVVDDTVSTTAAGEKVSDIYTFSINRDTGQLTRVGDVVKTLYSPTAIAVDPLGKFVYVTGMHAKGWRAVAAYTINPATGEITCTGTGAKGAKSIAFEPLGKFAYTIRDVGITGYSIDQRTGMLSSLVAPCDYDYCDDNEDNAEVYKDSVRYLKVDLSGQYLYAAANSGSVSNCDVWGRCGTTAVPAEIRAYYINQTDGRIYDTNFVQGQTAISPMAISPGVGVDSHTQFMYLLFNQKLNGLALNQLTGQVTDVGLDFSIGGLGLAAEPTGKLIYVFTSNYVAGYAIDPFGGKTQAVGTYKLDPATGKMVPLSPAISPMMATDAGAAGTLKAILFASY